MNHKILETPPAGYRKDVNDWSTLVPLLLVTLRSLKPKTILELGVGHYSSPVIAAYMCGRPKGYGSLHLENNREWADNLDYCNCLPSKVQLVEGWSYPQVPYTIDRPDLVVLDQAPECPDRYDALRYYLDHAKVVLVHDTWCLDRWAWAKELGHTVWDRRFQFGGTCFSKGIDVTQWF